MAILMEDQPTAPVTGWNAAIDPEVWAKVRERYVKGDRLTVLSEEFGLKYGTVAKRAQMDGWKKLREDHERREREAIVTPGPELANKAAMERMIGPRDDYIAQVDTYRAAAGVLQREFDRVNGLLNDAGLDNQDRVALTRTLIQLHERIQEALSIPSVKPVELKQGGNERRAAATIAG